MVPGWVPFKIVSDRPALHSRWLLLLKIEISSNGQNCFILSQNVPKFELYKHNDELFNIYSMGFFMNFELLPILTDYANQHRTLWEIHIKIFSSETTAPIATKLWWNVLGRPPSKIVSGDPDFQPRWLPSQK